MAQSDEAGVRALYSALHERWNARDAHGFAALFSEDGWAIGYDGSFHPNPKVMETDLAAIFAGHPTASYVASVRSVRFLSADTALLVAAAGLVPPGQSDVNPAVSAFQLIVATRRGGGWRIESLQNTPAAFHGRPEAITAMTEELREALKRERNRG